MLANPNRLPVTDAGVVIPKAWFGDATEVEINQENGHLVIMPVSSLNQPNTIEPFSAEDPIWRLGENPITIEGISDASTNLDKYLYGDLEEL